MITDSSAQVWAETRARPKRANPTVWRNAHNSRLETREKRPTVNHESRISQYANWESVSSSTAAPSSSSSSSSLASQTQPFSGPLSSIRLTKWSAFNEPPIPMHRHPLLAVLALRSLQPRLSSAWRYCRLALQMAQRATCIDKKSQSTYASSCPNFFTSAWSWTAVETLAQKRPCSASRLCIVRPPIVALMLDPCKHYRPQRVSRACIRHLA